MSSYHRFIEANRQTGSTTSLARVALEHDGYLIVPNLAMREYVFRLQPALRGDRVLTLAQIRDGKTRVDSARQVFVDPACLCCME